MRPCTRTSQVMWHAMPRSSHYPTHSPGGKKKPEMAKFRVTGHWAPLFPTKIGPTLLSPPTSMNGATCWPSQTPAGSLLFLPPTAYQEPCSLPNISGICPFLSGQGLWCWLHLTAKPCFGLFWRKPAVPCHFPPGKSIISSVLNFQSECC